METDGQYGAGTEPDPGPSIGQGPWTGPGPEPGPLMGPGLQQPWMGGSPRSTTGLRVVRGGSSSPVILAVGLVVGVIVLIVVLSNGGGGSVGPGSSSLLSWSETAGDPITLAQFRSVETGASMESVRGQFGTPASTGSNPLDQVSGDTQRCLGYRFEADASRLFTFCFEAGLLIEKQRF